MTKKPFPLRDKTVVICTDQKKIINENTIILFLRKNNISERRSFDENGICRIEIETIGKVQVREPLKPRQLKRYEEDSNVQVIKVNTKNEKLIYWSVETSRIGDFKPHKEGFAVENIKGHRVDIDISFIKKL